MEIDREVEPLVRAALDAAVAQDVDRLGAALRAFSGDDARRTGLGLTIAISGFALIDRYNGKPPAEEVREAAKTVAAGAQWIGVTTDEAEAYLTSLVDGTPLESALDPKTVVPLTFVITATLLAASPRIGEAESWSDYLDRVEAQLAATPT